MKILGIIPARYASSRFPGKPLADIAGKPMIERVYDRCRKAKSLSDVVVATDDKRIFDAVEKFGGNVILTSGYHLNGTSRCAEVLENYKTDENFDVIINIQGDEPLIHPEQIDELASLFSNSEIELATLVKRETDLTLLENGHIVKAFPDDHAVAVAFYRIIEEENLLNRIKADGFFYKHIGIYGFKAMTLQKIVTLSPTEHEQTFHLEQYRWLDNGYTIKTGITPFESRSVDTPEDAVEVSQIIRHSQPA
ncbi:MAG: 3-deoxy-manno-octulosonate cytidylyltransferase [Sphingobacteriales bacterium]|nr:3-deoxy-manno-octulosonate cytidylyltransferase [Sphingobacteriales bacterium]